MKLSWLTIVAPWSPSSFATYAPAKPPPTTSTPSRASIAALTRLASRRMAIQVSVIGSGSGARGARRGGRPAAGRAWGHRRDRRPRRGDGRGRARREERRRDDDRHPPGETRESANEWIDHVVVTGVGHARNLAVVASGDAVIAVGGRYGTLAEIGFALTLGRPVVVLEPGWEVEGDAARADPCRGGRARARGSAVRLAAADACRSRKLRAFLAVAADLHRAPGARAVARLVVEGDAAVLVAAAPSAASTRRSARARRPPRRCGRSRRAFRRPRERAPGGRPRTGRRGPPCVRPPPSVFEAAAASASTPLLHEEELPDRLADREGVGELLLGRLDEIVDETLLGEPHGELVGRRDRVDVRSRSRTC